MRCVLQSGTGHTGQGGLQCRRVTRNTPWSRLVSSVAHLPSAQAVRPHYISYATVMGILWRRHDKLHITGDISHWGVVSERMLRGMHVTESMMAFCAKRTRHIHARVGSVQARHILTSTIATHHITRAECASASLQRRQPLLPPHARALVAAGMAGRTGPRRQGGWYKDSLIYF